MSDTSSPAKAPSTRRLRAAAAASLLAVAGLVAGLVLPSFWAGEVDGASYRVGLVRVAMCVGAVCKSAGLALFGAGTTTWGRLGAAAFVAGGLAAGAQLVVAGLALRGGTGRWYRPRAAGVVGLLAVSLGAAFVMAQPQLGLEVGPALLAFFGGGAIAVGAGVALHPRAGR